MTRSFSSTPVSRDIIFECVDLAASSPSAGKSQGWNMLLLEGHDTHRYWDITFPRETREGFSFPHLFDAPCIFLVLADTHAYLSRYSEPDKTRAGLGESTDAWVAPYWTIDASFATMTFLLAVHEAGLGALFFAHAQEKQLRREFGIPNHVEILGTIALGYESNVASPSGRSASRPRRDAQSIIHLNRW